MHGSSDQQLPASSRVHEQLEHLTPAASVPQHQPRSLETPTNRSTLPRSLSCPSMNMHEFQLEESPLAVGGYAEVFKGTWLNQNEPVAVKRVLRACERIGAQEEHKQCDTIESFYNELNVMAQLEHPNVLKLVGAVVCEDNLCIVTEFVPRGSLFDLIHSKMTVSFKPEAVRIIAGQICTGMKYLHEKQVLHRDLKPGNILLGNVPAPTGSQLAVKIADFGLSKFAAVPLPPASATAPTCAASASSVPSSSLPHSISEPSLSSSLSSSSLISAASTEEGGPASAAHPGLRKGGEAAAAMTGSVGTAQYTAPEVLRSESYGFAADVYSFGVVLWEILARRVPFSGVDKEEVRAIVTADRTLERLGRPGGCPEAFWGLIQRCWASDPAERPSFAALEAELTALQGRV